ncbi:hypothetical protein GLOIN_2v1779779 [Rhizophagus irregularis DAOM 181602=DAOM 197198]|nr:hypothetical protein GLOIN_2v1779779 [Rhizophagus irregularis DAOM 181602=DAOM 197198]
MNLHAATSLAEDLGIDLIDIYGIHKWIQMWASPLNDPDIAYDRAVEKKEKAGDDLGQSFEEEGIGNHELHELNWKAYQKACKELSEARKEHCMVKWTVERCGFH